MKRTEEEREWCRDMGFAPTEAQLWTKATVAVMKAEAKRFITELDKVKFVDYGIDVPRVGPAHGAKTRIKRASLMLQNVLEDFRRERLP